MRSIPLGRDKQSGKDVRIPKKAFPTHFHLIGGTGKGKTTGLHTIMRQLMADRADRACFFVVDRLGNLSDEMLLWMASDDYCQRHIRERLVYIQPSREDAVLAFNPLLYETDGHGFYKVERATEIMLRAWESVNIEAMPRLARWTFNAFWAAAQLGLTIPDCAHFLMPGSPYHEPLLQCLPPGLKAEWEDINRARSGEAQRILDSSRNRLKPYFESPILRRMFGSTHNRLNVEQFLRDGKIVLLNLAPENRLSPQLANTIGALVLNEILATARSLPPADRHPAYIFLDEFQNFVGPDLEAALPEVRQLGLRFLLSHQSFSQLQRGEYDLTNMIFQCQSRLAFGMQGEDADILAHELAAINYDPHRIKDEIYSRRQRNAGHQVIELSSWSNANARAQQWKQDYGQNWSAAESMSGRYADPPGQTMRSSGKDSGHSQRTGEGESVTTTRTEGGHQTLVPKHEDFLELTTRTFLSFEEQKWEWAREVRNLSTGEALLRLVDDPTLYHVLVKRSTPGYLRYDPATLEKHFPQLIEAKQELIEKNFASELFVPAETVDREMEERLDQIANPRITLQAKSDAASSEGSAETGEDLFA